MSLFLEHLLDACSTNRDAVVILDKTGREESSNTRSQKKNKG